MISLCNVLNRGSFFTSFKYKCCLVFDFSCVLLAFSFHVRTQNAVKNKLSADVYRFLLDGVIACHAYHDVTLDRTFWHHVFICICVTKIISRLARLDALVAAVCLERSVFAAVAERVLIC